MSWIAGWHPFGSSSEQDPLPQASQVISIGAAKVWSTGQVITRHVSDPDGVELIVMGRCLATDDELRSMLPAIRNGNFSEAAWLHGSYLAVICRPGEVIVMGDLAGFYPVYYTRLPGGLLWSTRAKALAAYLGIKPNPYRAAFSLAVEQVPAVEGRSSFDGVPKIPDNNWLHLRGDRIQIERWYTPQEDATFNEASSALRSYLMGCASRYHKLGNVTSGFSGGIDSGATTSMAASIGEIHGLTYSDPWSPSDDVGYATAIAAEYPGIRHEILTLEAEHLPFSTSPPWAAAPSLDGPCDFILDLGADRAVYRRARELGSMAHLAGYGGDSVLSADRSSWADLYRSGQHSKVRAVATSYARSRNGSPRQIIMAVRRLARSDYPSELPQLARQLTEPHKIAPSTLADQIRWAYAPLTSHWLTPDMREWAAEELRRLATMHDGAPGGLTTSWAQVRCSIRDLQGCLALAEEFGLTVHTPFLDNTILDACLALPGWERRSLTSFKPLMTKGCADLLPRVLTSRVTKSGTENSNATGLRASAREIGVYLQDPALVEAQVCNQTALNLGFESVLNGFEGVHPGIGAFLGVEHWFRQLNLDRSRWWR
jgi:asparagine synthase (glutamine-hydrolysing)